MADSNIICSSLAVANGVGALVLAWAFSTASVPGGAAFPLPYLDLDHFEVWSANTNDRATATLAAQPKDTSVTVSGLTYSATRYFWVRAVDKSSNVGDWWPVSSTGGVSGTTLAKFTGTDLQPNSVPGSVLQVNTISARELYLGDFANLIPDAQITSGLIWLTNGGNFNAQNPGWTGFTSEGQINGGSAALGTGLQMRSQIFPVHPGDQLALYGEAVHHTSVQASHFFVVNEYSAAGVRGASGALFGSDSWSSVSGRTYSGTWTVPAGVYYAAFEVWSGYSGVTAGANHAYGGFYVRRKNEGALIVDGSIVAAKIGAGAVDATKVTAGTVVADLLIVGGKVITGHIGTQQVTTLASNPHWVTDNTIGMDLSYVTIDTETVTVTDFPVRIAGALFVNGGMSGAGNNITVAILCNVGPGSAYVEIGTIATFTSTAGGNTRRFDVSANHMPGAAGSYTYRFSIKNTILAGGATKWQLSYWGWALEASQR